MLIRRRKRLADFIGEEERRGTFTNPQKDRPTAQVNHHSIPAVVLPPTPTTPNIVWPFISKTRELTRRSELFKGVYRLLKSIDYKPKRMRLLS